MVEIIPYTENDEDQSNWIPLTSTADPSNANDSATKRAPVFAAAATNYTCTEDSAVRTNLVNSDSNPNATIDDLGIGYSNKGSQVDGLIAGGVDGSDDDNQWQKLTSKSASSQLQHPTTHTSSSASATEPSWSLGKQLITHLTSTTTTASVTDADDDASESEEDILWCRPDDLGGDDDDFNGLDCDHRHSSIEEEYDDEKTLATQRTAQNLFTKNEFIQQPTEPLQSKPQTTGTPHESQEEEQPRFQRIPEQQRKNEQTEPANPSVEKKLQQTFMHYSLRSFLRNLYHETKLQITLAWETYLKQNGLQSILAPLSLLIIVGLLGIFLIGNGLIGLGSLIVRTSVQVILSFCAIVVESTWAITSKMVWISICAPLLMGAIIWSWSSMNARGDATKSNNDKSRLKVFQFPSVSIILPWAVAFTSPSLYEVFIIILSLRTCISIINPRNHVEQCFFSPENDGNHSFQGGMASDQPISVGTSTLVIYASALLIAVMITLVITVAANKLEQDFLHVEDVSNGEADPREPSSTGSSEVISKTSLFTFIKCYNRIQRQPGTYHTISVLSLGVVSISILCIQMLYMHYIGTVLFGIGTIGINIVCIGLGLFILVTSWNFTITAITDNDSALASKICYGEILRKALKKSIIEAFYRDGAQIGLQGILSEDDGALRFAILEWFIDRWTTMSAVPSEETKLPSNDDFSLPAANDSNKNSNNDSSNRTSSPSSNHADSKSNNLQGRKDSNSSSSSSSSSHTNTSTSSHQPILPSYQSLQNVIAKLDADATLIPTIERYRVWTDSLFSSSVNAAMCIALWKMCPATAVLGLSVLWCLGWSAIGRLLSCFSWRLDSSSGDETLGWMLFMCTIITIMSPLLFLEYQRVRRWWAKTASQLKNVDLLKRDLVMILLRADADDIHPQSVVCANFFMDTSSLLLRIRLLLLESIAILESSIPVVRCATVACAAADLTNNAACLVGLAVEIKKRGLISGVCMFISDAFHYQLAMELKQRNRDTDDRRAEGHGDLGGQYTGAVVSAVENLGKMSHNITCLMDSKNEHHSKRSRNGSDSGDVKVESNEDEVTEACTQVDDHFEALQRTNDHIEDEFGENRNGSSQSDRMNVVPSPAKLEEVAPNPRDDDQGKESLLPDGSEHQNDNNGLMTVLIGGGLALVGAVAGMAVHSANNHREQDRRHKGSPK